MLVNITGGPDMTLFEVDKACHHIGEQVDSNANIIFGSTFDETLTGRIRVSVVATGIHDESEGPRPEQEETRGAFPPGYRAETAPASWAAAEDAGTERTFGLPPEPARAEPEPAPPEPAPEPVFAEAEPASEPLLEAAHAQPALTGRATDRIPSGGPAAPAPAPQPGAGTGTRSYSWPRLRRPAETKAGETAGAPAPAETRAPAQRPARKQPARDENLEIPEFLRRL